MIPKIDMDITQDFETTQQPSRTYRLDMENNWIVGMTDGLEAVKQAVYLILNTERYWYPIYSWDYGVELNGLYGQPAGMVYPEIERCITEALMQDDRITGVDGFSFEKERGAVKVSFTVHSIFGDIDTGKEVAIGA